MELRRIPIKMRRTNIIPIYKIEQLQEKIIHYDEIVSNMKVNNLSNNAEFNAQFSRIVDEMLGKD